MDDHVNPMDGMRPGGDYTAAQLGELLRLLNANYHLRGGDINTHPVLGGIRFSDPPTLDTCNKWLTDSGPVAEAAMMPGGEPIWPIGYQKAVAAIVEGRYRVCDDDPNVSTHSTAPMTAWRRWKATMYSTSSPNWMRNRQAAPGRSNVR